jgi:Reverse transcriptase (RNA-dependent DNA polymerase)/Endonuclease-reverse transcriptase
MYFYLIYRPPACNNDSKLLLCNLLNGAEKNSILIGDFNLPDIDWDKSTAKNRADQALLDAAQEANMDQLVGFPTHVRGNKLDLVLSNMPERINNVQDEGRLGNSDHSLISLEIAVKTMPAPKQTRKNWRKADWDQTRRGIRNTTWPTSNDHVTAEETWQLLKARIEQLTRTHVPTVVHKIRKSDWMTNEILQLVRRKRRLWKKAKHGQATEEYNEVAKDLKYKIRAAKRNLEKRLANETSGNKKPFYNYVKKKTKSTETVGPLKNGDGIMIHENSEMAEELNKQFSSVFTRDTGNDTATAQQHQARSKLNKSFITTGKVKQQIKKLKKFGAAGPDGITAQLLKECSEEISPVLAMLYRKSMDQCSVPTDWKNANVVPIFKKGSKSDASNYRPISLTCICCRMMESIIKEDIVAHLDRNRIIAKSQHGFQKNRSCTTNLLEFLEKVTEAADSGQPVDVVYLDFAKAFDKVPHARLLRKVEAAGIGGHVLKWIKDWLSDRKQRVIVNGAFSGWRAVLSGVPQGSVLGPVLFNIFINDIDREATCNQILKKFADDTKIAQILNSPNAAGELQATLDRLSAWATKWGMAFNVAKCHVMHIGRHNPRHKYKMLGQDLTITTSEKDVGVIISDTLKPSEQCRRAAQTANAVLGQILRSFHFRDRHVYVQLYVQYVRPHLEFATPAWAPWSMGDSDCLEKVQERAVKAISGLQSRIYEERLKEVGLPSLAARREEADMMMVYKILSDTDEHFASQWFTMAATERPATRQNTGAKNLVNKRGQHEYRRGFFSLRTTEKWNGLPDQVKNASRAHVFKDLYRKNLVDRVAPRQ